MSRMMNSIENLVFEVLLSVDLMGLVESKGGEYEQKEKRLKEE